MNITNPIIHPHIKKILTNYGVKKEFNLSQPNKKNLFNENEIVLQIYSAINKNNNKKEKEKDYNELMQILQRLPNYEHITELLFKFIEELQNNTYTISQLLAISTLLYRLSNINFATVELPQQFPNHSRESISNININKQPNHYKYIDKKIQEIVKNMITHYHLEIKNNRNYNYASNDGRLALKLKKILFSFIIDYTRPESSNTLFVKSIFQTEKKLRNYAEKHPEMMPRIIGNNPFNKK
jgi:hypothetical protein